MQHTDVANIGLDMIMNNTVFVICIEYKRTTAVKTENN